MIELPAALTAWAAELARLPTELALTLAPWIGRLALAVGPMAARRDHASGEPDGFTGLARRGPYERLLTTEWALAEVFPDEFVRRAATGEHLFLELARRGPQGARWTVAVVSAGPGQLGAPRLVHLAALVVLARRAAAANATFSWGVLEDPTLALVDGVDGAAVRRLLAARTMVSRGADGVAAWRAALTGDVDVEPWWIGGAAELATARAAGDACLIVRDPLEPGVDALDVEVARRGHPARLRLTLPAGDVCARLLREPGGAPAGRGRVARMGGVARRVRFGAGGRRLLVELTSGRVECWPIPNSPRDQLGKRRPWTAPAGHRLVALGVEQRTVLAALTLTGTPGPIELVQPTSPDRVQFMLPDEARAALVRALAGGAEAPLGDCVLSLLQPGAQKALVLHVADHLVAVDAFAGASQRLRVARPLHRASTTVIAAMLQDRRVHWAELGGDGAIAIRVAGASGAEPVVRLAPPASAAGAAPVVRFGFDVVPSGGWGPVAVSWGSDCTVAVAGLATQGFAVDAPVVGVGRWVSGAPALLIQPRDHALEWRGRPQNIALTPSPDPITQVAVCASQPYVAWVTRAGEVVLHSMRHGAALAHLVPGSPDPGEDAR